MTAEAKAPPSVREALSDVMKAVGAVAKRDRNEQQRFHFRGVDAVVNAVSPFLRVHGVVVMPELVDYHYGEIEVGKNRTPQGHARVTVAYHFHGPAGDTLTATVPGEAMDSGDKATPKAMSVAFRTALLQALSLPTDEPDPDSHSYERSQPAPPPDPEVVKLNAAKQAVLETWCVKRGDFDATAAAGVFAEWSGGELLGDATADRLDDFAAWLALSDPRLPSPPPSEEATDGNT